MKLFTCKCIEQYFFRLVVIVEFYKLVLYCAPLFYTMPRHVVKKGIPPTIGCYKIVKQLGAGSFGEIHLARDTRTKNMVAIKFEKEDNYPEQLRFETMAYQALQHEKQFLGFAHMYDHGTIPGYHYLVLSMLGQSLDTLRMHPKVNNNAFSTKTLLMVADQALQRLETMHSLGFVHRDIKPGNMMMGLEGTREYPVLHLIDFGLVKRFMDERGRHMPKMEQKTVVGTLLFMSINTQRGVEQSRRDDLESLAYVLIFLGGGVMPWETMEVPREKETVEALRLKIETPIDTICRGLPDVFVYWLEYARGLAFEAKPDYKDLRKRIHACARKAGITFDAVYDWDG